MYKLMIVDDELLMRIGIRSLLEWEEHGFQLVGEAENGKEALEIALETFPDLIITDIKMPLMDGLALIREISKRLPSCKYVILSNYDEIDYVKEALRLGALDYLIKSEISPATLTELLTRIRGKLLSEVSSRDNLFSAPLHYTQSLTHLKENFFKDLISGLPIGEEAADRAEQLQVRLKPQQLAIIKCKIDQFELVKKKYKEQDEKLLRFSILNVMEEVIPSRQSIEIIVESSSEYLVIRNVRLADEELWRKDIEKLCGKILGSMKDFMNLSFSVGVSTVVPDLLALKRGYWEADAAWRHRFFLGTGRIHFFDNTMKGCERTSNLYTLNRDREYEFRHVLERNSSDQLSKLLDAFRKELEDVRADENAIRKAYLLVLELVNSQFAQASRALLLSEGKTPYDAASTAETWNDLHELVLDYALQCLQTNGLSKEKLTYADMAVDIIHQYYAEDITLQSVASQINVNPSYLSRVFKQEKNENFVSYLTRIRIERAKSYLENRTLRVYEVADKVGYHNYTYFSKIFKKIVGVSPEEYRG
ncbi:two-component system response regulator YesN [Paenibacillus cellulosilyticus]|uniref:Two-component system response regulator YesN n=1 Tax=Paenibacillus cellulosilyticus TaxID=375489 RepID=A0A2V2Z2E0_9BACL|nr:response regulator [Paenibacillus cellulosilyticus]PWW07295.1 two-component system response regulator YesN [Paenibacillus cellulosilyticus]QKS44518.1 response regulator [Paenibacillus cellulosilyticus]